MARCYETMFRNQKTHATKSFRGYGNTRNSAIGHARRALLDAVGKKTRDDWYVSKTCFVPEDKR